MDKPSTATESGSSWSGHRASASGKRWIIAGFGLLVVILIAAAAGSAWQASIHRSDQDEMESHSATATLLQDAEAQGGAAAALLQEYVATGDISLVPEIQSRATTAVESLAKAVDQGDNADVNAIAVDGAGVAEGAGKVIALRQNGDVEGAAAAIEQITPAFQSFSLALNDSIAQELEEVSALQSSADRAGDLSLWLLVVSGAAGATLGLAASALIARSIIRRRVSKTPSPI